MFHSIAVNLLLIIGLYQVNCLKNLEANIWVPSFERLNEEKGFLNELELNKLLKSHYNPETYSSNNDDDEDANDEESSENSSDYENYLNYMNKKFLSDQLGNEDSEGALYDSIDSDEEIQNDERDQESENYSSLVGGYQFMSG